MPRNKPKPERGAPFVLNPNIRNELTVWVLLSEHQCGNNPMMYPVEEIFADRVTAEAYLERGKFRLCPNQPLWGWAYTGVLEHVTQLVYLEERMVVR